MGRDFLAILVASFGCGGTKCPPCRAILRRTAGALTCMSIGRAAAEQAVADARSPGDDSWMLTSSALCAADDRTRPGNFLPRLCSQEKWAGRKDADLRDDGCSLCSGARRAELARIPSEQFRRQLSRFGGESPPTCRVFSADVDDGYTGVFRRGHEIWCNAIVFDVMVVVRLGPEGPYGLVQARMVECALAGTLYPGRPIGYPKQCRRL